MLPPPLNAAHQVELPQIKVDLEPTLVALVVEVVLHRNRHITSSL